MYLKEKSLGRSSFPTPTGSWGYLWGVELQRRDGASFFCRHQVPRLQLKKPYFQFENEQQKKSYQLHKNKTKVVLSAF